MSSVEAIANTTNIITIVFALTYYLAKIKLMFHRTTIKQLAIVISAFKLSAVRVVQQYHEPTG